MFTVALPKLPVSSRKLHWVFSDRLRSGIGLRRALAPLAGRSVMPPASGWRPGGSSWGSAEQPASPASSATPANSAKPASSSHM